jgi:hypothetical protein
MFPIPSVLVADPHVYDYMHFLSFERGNKVEMVDGGGQVINAEAKGHFKILPVSAVQADVEFYDLAEHHTYGRGKKANIEGFTVRVTQENGVFAFREIGPWGFEADKWPCLLYRARYVFERDPLEFARQRRGGNLFNLTEGENLLDSDRFYYDRDDVKKLAAKDLAKLGIQL